MTLWLYRLFLFLYVRMAKLLSLFNPKAKAWIDGRKDLFAHLSSNISNNDKWIWMHASSLGEYEQGKPILHAIRKQYPQYKIGLSFFSPSGYQHVKKGEDIDYITYLPLDSPAHAKEFWTIIHPVLIVWVKYDFWYYFLEEAKKQRIPILLVSAIFTPKQWLLKPYGKAYSKVLTYFAHIFVQNQESKNLLLHMGIAHVSFVGDTRFDRVIEIASQWQPIRSIEAFIGTSTCLVAGSTWEEDDELLKHFIRIHPHIKCIIAPHHIDDERMNSLLLFFKDESILFTEWEKDVLQQTQARILIVNTMGMLSRLYKYGVINYVGGGLNRYGIHNVLEAAVYGKAIIIGYEYEDYQEAIDLVEIGGAIVITNTLEFEDVLSTLLENNIYATDVGYKAQQYVYKNKGGTSMIMNYITENRLLID